MIMYSCIWNMSKYVGKKLRTISFVILAFILGCTFTLTLIPIDWKCQNQFETSNTHTLSFNLKFKNPELIILILSTPTNFEKRATLRESWLKLKPDKNEKVFKVKHYFALGVLSLSQPVSNSVHLEVDQYDDILKLPLTDSYKNLTEKIKLSFQWLDKQLDYKYVLKCDDDSFVNLKLLISSLMNLDRDITHSMSVDNLGTDITMKNNIISTNFQNSGSNKGRKYLYWGYFSGNARIKTGGKWKENNWIASDQYVPYALGGGYLLSKELVSYIAKNANYLKSFNSEDVSVGFWLSPVNNIYRVHDIRFDTEWTSRGCKNNNLITHNISPLVMRQLYKNLINTDKICSKESISRHYYIYDWDVPPSQCCKRIQKDTKLN